MGSAVCDDSRRILLFGSLDLGLLEKDHSDSEGSFSGKHNQILGIVLSSAWFICTCVFLLIVLGLVGSLYHK